MSSVQNHASGYGIKHLSESTGLSRHVLRKWEQRYHLLAPRRAANGYRVYDAQELQLLFFLKHKLTTGASIGRLALQGREALRDEMNAGSVDVPRVLQEAQPQARELIQAARQGNRAAVDRTITRLIQQWGVDRALTGVFFPVLETIGELWHQGRISVNGENLVSQTIQQLLVQSHRFPGTPQAPSDHPQALVACVPNDFHEIGAMSAVRFLRHGGWTTTYLGPDVSVDVVRLACRRRHGKLVLFSCVIEPTSDDMKDLIDEIVRQVLSLTTVIMGGRGAGLYQEWLEQRGIGYIDDLERVKGLTPVHVSERLNNMNRQERQP